MNGQERIDERRRRQAGRRGFTLIELLVVILIILLVSAVVLPTVLPAISHRQVSEAARILQGALAGARDTAINNNAPAGIRLLPDPVLNGQSLNAPVVSRVCRHSTRPRSWPPTGTSRSSSRRIIRRGLSMWTLPSPTSDCFQRGGSPTPGIFPLSCSERRRLLSRGNLPDALRRAVGLQSPTTHNLFNSPTSWYWNIRIGDKIQLNNTGIWYTIVGPMNIYNPELFVNVGDPGTTPPLLRTLERHELQPGVPLSGQRRGRQQGRLRGQRLGRHRQRWRWDRRSSHR